MKPYLKAAWNMIKYNFFKTTIIAVLLPRIIYDYLHK